ncbi:MAG TPA: efflux RND transporter permease subunit [Caldilineae bacterium]|nr:efflux RND transporter permease subunit [Caldilineae bacterium]
MKLWDFSIRNPVATTMIMAALVVLGVVSFFRMPVDLFPDISFPIMAITTVYPGAGPDQTQSQITELLEEEMSSISGVDSITSESGEGYSLVIIQFTMDSNADKAAQNVREKLDQLRNRLPADAMDPILQRFDPSSTPIMIYAVTDVSGQYLPVELGNLVKNEIQPQIQRVPGVAVAEVKGAEEREIQVDMDMLALQGKYVAPQQVTGAIQSYNYDIPGGPVPAGDKNVLVRTPSKINTVEDLDQVVVSQRGAPIRIADVAVVHDSFKEKESYSRVNGGSALVINVYKQSGSNTVKVADGVIVTVKDVEATHPELQFVKVADSSTFVRESVADAVSDTVWGAILATLVVLFFFRNLRNTLITMIGLPVILIGTIWGLDMFGISLNMISLLALALVVGLVIDDAIVVRENIFRWINMGYSPREAASKATAEVSLAVLATSATIIAVFLPIAFSSGIVGKFMRDFGMTVVIAIIISTFEALTLAPMISAYFFAKKKIKAGPKPLDGEINGAEEAEPVIDESKGEEKKGEGWMYRTYGRLLNWMLDHKKLSVAAATALVALSLLSFPFINQTLLADIDEGEFTATLTMPPGTRLEVTDEHARQVEDVLIEHPDTESVFTTVGRQGAPEEATFAVQVSSDAQDGTRAVMDELRAQLADVPGMTFQLSGGAFDFVGVSGVAGQDIVIEVKSQTGDLEALAQGTEQTVQQLAAIPGLTDVRSNLQEGKPEMRIDVDEDRAAQFGLNPAYVGSTIRTLLTGDIASTYRGEGPEAEIRVWLQESDRDNLEDVLNYKLLTPTGQLVPLRNVATLTTDIGATSIHRIDRMATATIGANFTGRSVADVEVDLENMLATIQLPAGVTAELGGQAAMEGEAFANLYLSLLLAITFVYMVLASQFKSFTQPIIIMMALPLSVIGAILALLLTRNPMDMTAMIGFIMLMGLATKNSILLVDFANKEHEKGVPADKAMRLAGPVRLRPILMTAISLILGMVPVALGLGAGGDFRAPMAIAVIGGMSTSTVLTLFIVPLAYVIWVNFQDRWKERRAAKKAAKEAAETMPEQEAAPA